MRALLALPLLSLLTGCSDRLPDIDPDLAREIAAIKVIDNHGHPLTVPAEGEKADDEYDALVFEEMEPAPAPVRIRDNNTEYVQAWKLLYGYRYDDMSEAHVKDLIAVKERTMREKGEAYPAWVLDRLGIDTMLANRVAMGRGLAPPRFRWVTYVDALMLPLPDERRKRENPDYRAFYKAQERLLQRHMKESGVAARPVSLDDFEKQVVTATLERQKSGGAIGVKFEAAYLRSLDVADVAKDEAAKVYAKYAKGGEPTYEEYKALQDYLFRFIAREAGRLSMAVHIHLCGGAGGYYKLGGTNPTLLDGVLSDTTLRKTNFVLVHGGWPFTREAGFLLTKPHVYADISAMTFVLYPRELSEILRSWLNLVPERVLYGGDVEPFMPQINWEETGWLTVTTGRKALGLALSGMIRDGEISRPRALEVARLVLRGNAERLYGFRN
jgi:predicted TIM-barrel fold metal-dependent hydrolase